jgi:antitoxin component YwqK of YwqJK toxin-antitoxin module
MKKTIALICISFLVQSGWTQKIITNYWGYTKKIRQQYQVDANGAENGFWKSFSNEGKLLEHYNYLHGQKHGKQLKYFRGISDIEWCMGQPLEIQNYEKDKMLMEEVYKCNNGKPQIWYKKIDDDKLYEYTLYYDNGKMKEHTKKNKLDKNTQGIYEMFHENGKKALTGFNSSNGRKNGMWYAFYENGDTQYVINYFENITTQLTVFDENKKITRKLKSEADLSQQVLEYFDENGNLTKRKVTKSIPFDSKDHSTDKTTWVDYLKTDFPNYAHDEGDDPNDPFGRSNAFVSEITEYNNGVETSSQKFENVINVSCYTCLGIKRYKIMEKGYDLDKEKEKVAKYEKDLQQEELEKEEREKAEEKEMEERKERQKIYLALYQSATFRTTTLDSLLSLCKQTFNSFSPKLAEIKNIQRRFVKKPSLINAWKIADENFEGIHYNLLDKIDFFNNYKAYTSRPYADEYIINEMDKILASIRNATAENDQQRLNVMSKYITMTLSLKNYQSRLQLAERVLQLNEEKDTKKLEADLKSETSPEKIMQILGLE